MITPDNPSLIPLPSYFSTRYLKIDNKNVLKNPEVAPIEFSQFLNKVGIDPQVGIDKEQFRTDPEFWNNHEVEVALGSSPFSGWSVNFFGDRDSHADTSWSYPCLHVENVGFQVLVNGNQIALPTLNTIKRISSANTYYSALQYFGLENTIKSQLYKGTVQMVQSLIPEFQPIDPNRFTRTRIFKIENYLDESTFYPGLKSVATMPHSIRRYSESLYMDMAMMEFDLS